MLRCLFCFRTFESLRAPCLLPGAKRLDQSCSPRADFAPSLCQLPGVCPDVSGCTVPAGVLPPRLTLHPFTFSPRYFFPRQILIPHFWNPGQRVEFRGVYHSLRARHHRPVIAGLQQTSRRIEDGPLRGRLLDLCAKVRLRKPRSANIPGGRRFLPSVLLFSGAGRSEPQGVGHPRCSRPVLQTAS